LDRHRAALHLIADAEALIDILTLEVIGGQLPRSPSFWYRSGRKITERN